MARLPRNVVLPAYGVFHVTVRGVDRCVIYRDAQDYVLFMALFRRVVARYSLRVEAYCLMPNHFHAIVECERDALSHAMKRLNGIYAQEFNALHGRVGHLFQERFHAKLVGDDEYLSTACEYVWANPVRARLCAEVHHWPWSGRMLRPRVSR